ncbi:uncharacterized protein TNCV_1711211 [Trichonephila clavipes]|nr:uncharacterized protein TNCV_1711211 [Trichonephila clavipes]
MINSSTRRSYSAQYPSYCTIASAVQCLYTVGSCHRRIPLSRDTPSSLRISAEGVLGYVLTHPEISVWDISKNTHWSLENPHLVRPNHHQVRWSVNVGCGIWKSTLMSSMYCDGPLTSESYTEILSGPLADFLEDEVSLRDLSRMWYQHDGATHQKFAQPFTFLAQTLDSGIIGYEGQEEWSP